MISHPHASIKTKSGKTAFMPWYSSEPMGSSTGNFPALVGCSFRNQPPNLRQQLRRAKRFGQKTGRARGFAFLARRMVSAHAGGGDDHRNDFGLLILFELPQCRQTIHL